MCIKPTVKSSRGWTLVEVMIAAGVFSISAIALATVFLYSIRSFAAIANYSALEEANRHAVDVLSREIRQCRAVVEFTGNSISLRDGNNAVIAYNFDPQSKQLTRFYNGSTEVLLTDCDLLTFTPFQRNPKDGSYDVYPVATNNWQGTVKGVQLSWKTRRILPHGPVNSENVQTARIVIRKKYS